MLVSQLDVHRGGEQMNSYTVWQCLFLIWVESTDSIFSPESLDFIHHAELSDLCLARHTQPHINSSLFTISFCVIHSSPPAMHSYSQTLFLHLFFLLPITSLFAKGFTVSLIVTTAFLSCTSQCLFFRPLRYRHETRRQYWRDFYFSVTLLIFLLLYLLPKFNMHRTLLLFVRRRCIARDAIYSEKSSQEKQTVLISVTKKHGNMFGFTPTKWNKLRE